MRPGNAGGVGEGVAISSPAGSSNNGRLHPIAALRSATGGPAWGPMSVANSLLPPNASSTHCRPSRSSGPIPRTGPAAWNSSSSRHERVAKKATIAAWAFSLEPNSAPIIHAARSVSAKLSQMQAEDSRLSGPVLSSTGVRNNLSSVSWSRHPVRASLSVSEAKSGTCTSMVMTFGSILSSRHIRSASETSDMNAWRPVASRGESALNLNSALPPPSSTWGVAGGVGVAMGVGSTVGVGSGTEVGAKVAVGSGAVVEVAAGAETGVGVGPEHASDTTSSNTAAQDSNFNM